MPSDNGTKPPNEDAREDRLEYDDPYMAKNFTQLSNLVLRDPELSPQAVRIYGLLRSYSWQKSNAFPSKKTLAEPGGKSERSVYDWINELIAARLIRKKRHDERAPDGTFKTRNTYYFRKLEDRYLPDGSVRPDATRTLAEWHDEQHKTRQRRNHIRATSTIGSGLQSVSPTGSGLQKPSAAGCNNRRQQAADEEDTYLKDPVFKTQRNDELESKAAPLGAENRAVRGAVGEVPGEPIDPGLAAERVGGSPPGAGAADQVPRVELDEPSPRTLIPKCKHGKRWAMCLICATADEPEPALVRPA